MSPLLSRVADSIYWTSRYIERAENLSRFIGVNLNLWLDMPPGVKEQWEPLLEATAQRAEFLAHYDEVTQQNVIEFLTFDPDNPNSILRCLHAARGNAHSVREAISSEMWEQINKFYLFVKSQSFRGLYVGDPLGFFERIKTEAHLFAGIMDATMSHGEAWNFGRLGRLLERADKTSRILDVKYFILLPSAQEVGTPFDNLQWAALLRSASGLEAYRKQHGRIAPERVAEFLLLDQQFPRSVLFCVSSADESLRAITGTPPASFSNAVERLVGRLKARLTYARIQEIVTAGLHEFLDELQAELNAAGDAIVETFFAMRPVAPVGPRRHLELGVQ